MRKSGLSGSVSLVADSGEDARRVSRRRVLQGVAWSAPAILIATSAPARAASLAPDQGVALLYLQVSFQSSHWNSTQGVGMQAVTVQANIQNAPAPAPDPTPLVTLQVTYQVPVGAITNPAWGLGANYAPTSEGIAAGAPWVLAAPVTVSAGVATISFTYTGAPIPQYDTRQPTVWVQAAGNQVGSAAMVTAVATHLNGDVSSDVMAGAAVLIADDPPGLP